MSHIDKEKRIDIDKSVERIKLDTGLSYPENSLSDIAKALGVEVLETELPPYEGKKVKGVITWLEKEEGGEVSYSAKIILDSSQSDTTKSFTLAHELGHYVLHKNSNSFRIDLQDYSKEGDPENQETEANYFAGSLLMPKDKLLLLVLKEGKSQKEIAGLFGVSVPAVESRLKWLLTV